MLCVVSKFWRNCTCSRCIPRDCANESVLQAQAADIGNNEPSASQPLPISTDGANADIEANWDEEQGREISASHTRTAELSNSFREVSSSAVTAIWRGFEAVGRATGLSRRPSREDLDRDR